MPPVARAAEAINDELGVGNPEKIKQEGFLRFDRATAGLKTANNGHNVDAAARRIDKEDSTTLTYEEGLEEAKRCMNCGCYSVNASDLSPVMVMMDAVVKTSKGREIPAEEFFCTNLKSYANLEQGELICELVIPEKEGFVTGYEKFRMRSSIDFSMASLAWGYKMEGDTLADIRLVLGAVAPVPVRLNKVEDFLRGKKPTFELAAQAGEMATEGAESMGHNDYKIDEIRTFVRRMVESLVK